MSAKTHAFCILRLAHWHFPVTRLAPAVDFNLATLCARDGIFLHTDTALEALADVLPPSSSEFKNPHPRLECDEMMT